MNLLKTQQRILKSHKNLNNSLEKSRNMQMKEKSTSNRDQRLDEIERCILSTEANSSMEKKIQTLSESLKSVINLYLSNFPKKVISTLNLINKKFSNIVKISKGKEDYEIGKTDNNLVFNLKKEKENLEKIIKEQK